MTEKIQKAFLGLGARVLFLYTCAMACVLFSPILLILLLSYLADKSSGRLGSNLPEKEPNQLPQEEYWRADYLPDREELGSKPTGWLH